MKLFAEQRQFFPHPSTSSADGLVDVNDNINTEMLLEAYSFGIFPWPYEGLPILWFSPKERGVLDFADLKVPKSFKKFMKHSPFELTVNKAFGEVVERCSLQLRPNQDGTWITPRMRKAYEQFQRDGYAFSFEAWENKTLVGGLYGVFVGGVFAGESMFFAKPNASKFCLFSLIEILSSQGVTWMDIQMVTPLLKMWGGKYISRQQFLLRLERTHQVAKPLMLPNHLI